MNLSRDKLRNHKFTDTKHRGRTDEKAENEARKVNLEMNFQRVTFFTNQENIYVSLRK